MRTIALLVALAACGKREVQPLAPQPTPVPAASDKTIMTPTPELRPPPDAPQSASVTGGGIHISVETDAGVPIDGAALPPLPDALIPDAAQRL